MSMRLRLRRAVVMALLLGTLTAGAANAQVAVFDPLNIIQRQFLNAWRSTIGVVLTQQLGRIRQMAERLSAVTSLVKYVAPDAPLWRTRRIDDALAASDAFMDALNAGDATGAHFAGAARRRAIAGPAFAAFGAESEAAVRALRSALATIDIADSAIIAGMDQAGRIRGNRRSERAALDALEQDVSDADLEQSASAVLDKVSAASVIRARQQDTRMQLLGAVTEQLLVDAKRDRDTEAAAMNMQLGRLERGRAVANSLLAGSADAFRSWRQP
jgi:hypothetical protein